MSVKTWTIFVASAIFLSSVPAFAQEAQMNPLVGVVNAPQFFISIAAGLLLAFGFQSVLTALSVAVGLSSTPNLKELSARHHARQNGVSQDESSKTEEDLKKDGSMAVKATSTFGFWAMITTSVALFFATWLAVRLSFIDVTEIGLVLGLVIWAAFFMAMTYLELRTVRSAIGGITNLAFSSVRTTFDAVKGVFSPSLDRQVEEASRKSVRAIYDEINQISHHDKLDKKLHDYLIELKPKVPDYNQIRDDIRDLIDHIQVEERISVEEEDVVRVLEMHLEKGGVVNREKVSKLMETAREASREAKKQEGPADKAIAAAAAVMPLSRTEIQHYIERIEQYLHESGAEELEPEQLKHDIENIFSDPKASREIIRQRVAGIDEDTLRKLLANHPKVSEEQAEKYSAMLMHALDFVRGKHEEPETAAEVKPNGGGMKAEARGLPKKVEGKIAAYFESLGQPELNYQDIKRDINEMLHDPASAPEILKHRLSQIDRETLVALLSSNKHVSDEQAENIANKIIEIRDQLTEKMHKVEDEALRRYKDISRRTIIAAEQARESAIAASWWTVATAMVSGFAAAMGGYLGTSI